MARDVGAAIAATDPEEDTLTYSLGGTDKDSFSLDTSSGQLKTRTDLDYESPKKSYTVDSVGLLTARTPTARLIQPPTPRPP